MNEPWKKIEQAMNLIKYPKLNENDFEIYQENE